MNSRIHSLATAWELACGGRNFHLRAASRALAPKYRLPADWIAAPETTPFASTVTCTLTRTLPWIVRLAAVETSGITRSVASPAAVEPVEAGGCATGGCGTASRGAGTVAAGACATGGAGVSDG